MGRGGGGRDVFTLFLALWKDTRCSTQRLSWSLLHVTGVLNHDMNVVGVCRPRWCGCVNTVLVPGKGSSSMLLMTIPACPCCTHSNTVRSTVGSGTGDRCHSLVPSALVMVHTREVSCLIANPDTCLFSLLGRFPSLTKCVALPPAWVRIQEFN